jgi:hypothetical protein
MEQQTPYLSWLLRLWQECPGEELGDAPLWRASLETPSSHDLQCFASLAGLFSFLEEQTGSRSPESGLQEAGETGLDAEE